MTTSAPLRCKCRKQAVTSLRCARCFVPICPDCSIVAPVGMLCRECSRGKPSHLYQVNPKSLALAYPITLLAATFGGWLMYTVSSFGFFGIFAGFLYGLGIGEIALRLTNRKRGFPIELMAGLCTFLGLAAGFAIGLAATSLRARGMGYPPGDETIAPNSYNTFLIVSFFLNPWMYVSAAVAIFGAVSRIRNIG